MKKTLRTFLKKFAIVVVIFGVSFSNIPFYAFTSVLDGYVATLGVVDKAFHLAQDSDVVDNFTPIYRGKNLERFYKLAGEMKIEEAYAAVTFVGSASNSTSGNTDTTVSLTGIPLQNGDLVIVAGSIGDDDNIDHDVLINTAGYTEVADLFANDTDNTNVAVWYKFMGATPDTSVIVEGSTGGLDSSIAVTVMAFRGVDPTTPMDVAATTAVGGNTFNPNPPAITHNNPAGIITVIVGANSHVLGGTGTYTFPTGYTTNAIFRGHNDTNDTTVGMGYRNSGVSNPEDPGVMTHSGSQTTSNSWAAVTMALRPYVPPADTTAPTPNPMTFATAPNNTSATQIDMTATTATDVTTPPVSYYFALDTTVCTAANIGTGAADSGWQSGTTYSDIGLAVNKCYGYKVKARDSVSPTPNETGYSGITTLYTSANTPSAPTVGSPTETTLVITNNENGNPLSNPITYFAVQVTTADANWNGKWVNASGASSATAVWLTDAQLTNLTVTGLTGSTLYDFNVKARNNDGDETGLSTAGSGTTSAPAATLTISQTAGSKVATKNSGAVDQYAHDTTCTGAATCAAFTLTAAGGTVNVTSIKVTENGTVTADNELSDVNLYYDFDGNWSDAGAETLFGTQGLFAPDQTATISGTLAISAGATAYIYVRYDLAAAVYPTGGATVNFQIASATDVISDGTESGTGTLAGIQTVRPNVTSITYPITSPINGSRIGQSITINGAGFGDTCDGVNNRVTIGGVGNVVSCTGTTFSNTSISITNFQYLSGDSYGGAATLLARVGATDDNASQDMYVYPDITDVTNPTAYTNAAREYSASDSDGVITINGNHFGTAQGSGSVTVLGQTASIVSWGATAIQIQIPTTIGDGDAGAADYQGNIISYQGTGGNSSALDTYGGGIYRILPRIISTGPINLKGGQSQSGVSITGNHLCQDASCVGSPEGTEDITFNAVSGKSGSTWSHTSITTITVPATANDGNLILTSDGDGAGTFTSNALNYNVKFRPSTPTGSSAGGSNPTLSGTAFSDNTDGDTHLKAQWQIAHNTDGDWTISNDTSELYILSLTFDSTNGVIYAGSGSGAIIYRCVVSTGCDASGDWTISYDSPSENIIYSLTFDSTNGVIYAGSGYNGIIYRCAVSTTGCDESSDWTISNDTFESIIYSLIFDSTNGVIYAGSSANGIIYRCAVSTACDASGDWTISYDDPVELYIYSLTFDSTNGVIYAGSAFGGGIIYRCAVSTACDASGDWTTSYDTSEGSIYSLIFDSTNGVIYAGSGSNGIIYRCAVSTGCDASGDWTISNDTSESEVRSLIFANGVIYAGSAFGSGIIYRCAVSTACDASGDWTISNDAAEPYIFSLTFDSTNGVIYAGSGTTNGVIYRCAVSTGCDESGWTTPEWSRTSGSAETGTTVNAANGTFANSDAGQTELDCGTTYKGRVRYMDNANGGGDAYAWEWSSWSSDYTFSSTACNVTPTLTVTQPDGTGDTVTVGDLYNITYDLADPDNVVTAAMYYDTDAVGLNGTAITGACATAAEGTGVTCSWNTTGMTVGTYYVYGIANDGVNPAVNDYSPGIITINAPPQVTADASGTQTTPMDSGATGQYIGAVFRFQQSSGSADTITALTISETGTVNANANLSTNAGIRYESGVATCTYNGTETLVAGTFNVSEKMALSSLTIPVTVGANYTCVYVVFDVASGAVGGQTIELEITAASDFTLQNSTAKAGTYPVALSGTTTVRPNVTSITYPITSPLNGARIGQSITINGAGFGTTCDGTNNRVTIGGVGNVVSCTGTTFSDTSISITNFQYSSGDSYGGAATLLARIGATDDNASQDMYVYPDITDVTNPTAYTNAAREYSASDSDGVVTINGNHFGTAQGTGSVTVLGTTVSGGDIVSWGAAAIQIRIPTAIADNSNTGNIVVYQGAGGNSSALDTYGGGTYRILPRITGFTPGNGEVGAAVQVDGNHFCQNGGTCPSSFNASNKVTFASTVDATVFTGWIATAMNTQVPASAVTGNVVLKSNGYDSNGSSFSVDIPTPATPTNLKQSRNAGITDLIATGGIASSTPVYFAGDTSSTVTGGTMYLQVEMRPTTGGASTFTSTCTSNPYCFEGPGFAYGGGTITATSSTSTVNDLYHWQTRARYNKSSTDYFSTSWQCYPSSGCNSENATDLKVDTTAPVISNIIETPSMNGGTIAWATDELATTQLEYGTDSGLVGSTLTAITDTPAETNGKTTEHSVSISNLTCATVYYYRARSRDSGNIEGMTAILDFPTSSCLSKPAKTAVFHIVGATGSITGATAYPFSVTMPELATSTQSAFVELTGVYETSASSITIAVQHNSEPARTYTLPGTASGTIRSHFKIIHKVTSVNYPASNTLTVTPALATVYISSAKITVTYAYTP